MLRITATIEPTLLLMWLIWAAIYFTASAEGLDAPSGSERERDKPTLEIVSRRNPNVIIGSPLNFAWLPESINAYYLASLAEGSKNFPAQKTIQDAIADHLSASGYEYNGAIHSGRAMISRKRKKANIRPKDLIAVKNWRWAGANFGASGILREITIENRGDQDVKDIRIKIGYLGTSGEKEGYWGPTSIFVIHGNVPANSEKTFRDINIGFRHPDEIKASMSVLSVKTVVHDLLVGYFLVPEKTVNDSDLNRTYNITSGPSENNLDAKPNEYKRGTLIIDVIDAETYGFVWRGAAQPLADSDSPQPENNEMIERAVGKLIKGFVESNK